MASKELNSQLLQRLECPVCFETCLPPIYMCSNGHAVCAKCRPKLAQCGTCRAPGKPNVRCVALESIAELVMMPCANKSSGCTMTFKMSEMEKHLPWCGFKCHICAEWKISATEIKTHVLLKHPEDHFEISVNGNTFKQTKIQVEREFFERPSNFMYTFGEDLLWLENEYDPATRIYSKTIRIVSHKDEDASRYFFSVELTSKDEDDNYSVLYRANVLTENATCSGKMDIVLPASVTDADSDESLDYTLKISRKSPDTGACSGQQGPSKGQKKPIPSKGSKNSNPSRGFHFSNPSRGSQNSNPSRRHENPGPLPGFQDQNLWTGYQNPGTWPGYQHPGPSPGYQHPGPSPGYQNSGPPAGYQNSGPPSRYQNPDQSQHPGRGRGRGRGERYKKNCPPHASNDDCKYN